MSTTKKYIPKIEVVTYFGAVAALGAYGSAKSLKISPKATIFFVAASALLTMGVISLITIPITKTIQVNS